MQPRTAFPAVSDVVKAAFDADGGMFFIIRRLRCNTQPPVHTIDVRVTTNRVRVDANKVAVSTYEAFLCTIEVLIGSNQLRIGIYDRALGNKEWCVDTELRA